MVSNVKTCGVTWCKYVSDVVLVANKNVHLLGFVRARDAGESIKPGAQAPGSELYLDLEPAIAGDSVEP